MNDLEDRKKTYIADIERGVYDIKDEMKHEFTTKFSNLPNGYGHMVFYLSRYTFCCEVI